MPTVVVDASALAAVLFVEPRGEDVARQLAGNNLVAPELIRYEVLSVALKKLERPEDRPRCLTGLRRFGPLGVREVEVPLGPVFELAAQTGLTTYDASYLWLARSLGVPLITLDSDLATAAA